MTKSSQQLRTGGEEGGREGRVIRILQSLLGESGKCYRDKTPSNHFPPPPPPPLFLPAKDRPTDQ